MAIPYKPFDWNNIPKDAKIRMLEIPDDESVFWIKKREEWKLELPIEAGLTDEFGFTTDEVQEWIDNNLLGATDGYLVKASIMIIRSTKNKFIDPTATDHYEIKLYCEHDFILFKMRWQ